MYEINCEVPFSCAGADGKMRLPDAVGMMIDCCQFQEYQEKALCEYLRRKKIAIFLSSIQVDILRLPEFRERVRTAVKIYGCKSIYGLRRITMHDENGELCLISNATGAFFDIEAGRAVKLDPDDLGVVFDEAEPMACLPRKISVPASGGIAADVFKVTPSVVDCNGHLTSAAYFAVSSDVLPAGFLFNRARMEYKKQAKAGEIMIPVLHCVDNRIVVDMKNEDGTSFAVAEYSYAMPEKSKIIDFQ